MSKNIMVVSTDCVERGCMAHDDRVDGPGVVVQPAQIEQEPVAYGMWDTMLGKGNRMMMVRLDKGQDGCTVPLYTTPPQPEHWSGVDFDIKTTPPQRKPLTDERIESVRHMRDVQGYDGNWNYDPYMQGLYNGLEFALSLLEVRQPEFKDAPETWLGDIKVKRDKLSSGAAHGIKE